MVVVVMFPFMDGLNQPLGLATYIPVSSSKQHIVLRYPHFCRWGVQGSGRLSHAHLLPPQVSAQICPREALSPPPHTPCPTVPMHITAHITTCDYLVTLSGSVSPLQGELHEGRVCPVIAALPEPRTGAWKIGTH